MNLERQIIRTSDMAATKLFFEQLFGSGEEDGSGWVQDDFGHWIFNRLEPPIFLVDAKVDVPVDVGTVSEHICVRPKASYHQFRNLLERLNILYSIVGGAQKEHRILAIAPGGAMVEMIFPRAGSDL